MQRKSEIEAAPVNATQHFGSVIPVVSSQKIDGFWI
jgi:hypothetical protein